MMCVAASDSSRRGAALSRGEAEVFVGLASFRGANGAVPGSCEAHIYTGMISTTT